MPRSGRPGLPADQREWHKAQGEIVYWLRRHGIACKMAPYRSAYDIISDAGTRIEVKRSELYRKGGTCGWQFNIHRHGVLDESQVDAYILKCEAGEFPDVFGRSFYLIVPAPLRRLGLWIAPVAMMLRWGQHHNKVEVIKELNDKRSATNGH